MGGCGLREGKEPLFCYPRREHGIQRVFPELTIVGRGLETYRLVAPTLLCCSHRVLFLVFCRLEVRVFRGVEKVSVVILGIGRANSLDCHHCWESAWD